MKMRGYLENMVMDSYPDQVVIMKEECSGDEENPRSEEEEDEHEEEKNENEDIHKSDNKHSNSYASTLTTMDWGFRSHPDYQEDYWIGDNGASSHMVHEDKDLFGKTSIQGKVNAPNGKSIPTVKK